jgi:hypothetical protein
MSSPRQPGKARLSEAVWQSRWLITRANLERNYRGKLGLLKERFVTDGNGVRAERGLGRFECMKPMKQARSQRSIEDAQAKGIFGRSVDGVNTTAFAKE